MNLENYLFEQSYLMGFEYNPIECSIKLLVDAKMTYDHPRISCDENEPKFVDVEIVFEGVQYLRVLNSLLLKKNPNDDLGSIEKFYILDNNGNHKDLSIEKDDEKSKLSLELLCGEIVSVYSKSLDLKFVNFISEMISFELSYQKIRINEFL